MECCRKLDLCLLLLPLVLHFLPLQGTSSTVILPQPQVPCLFIFGDSLVDNGNNNRRNTTARANYSPYGIDFPAGPTGRFNNGRNIADIIAELLGFDRYIPPFADAANEEDILRGFNYGSGGSGILNETGRHLGDVICLNEQLSNHEVVISWIAKLLGSEIAAKEHLSKCIYLVEMGNNDYLNNYFSEFYSATQQSPQQFASLLIDHYSKQLRMLYDFGARKVAVSAIGKLGCIPRELAIHDQFLNGSNSCVETSNDIVELFNERLQILLNHLNYHFPDAKFIYTAGLWHSSANSSYGNITILRSPCCVVSKDGSCIAGTSACSNRDEYMFWDAFHPTEAANLIFAKSAYDDMSPLYSPNNPIDIL